jgi:hypothetical protein
MAVRPSDVHRCTECGFNFYGDEVFAAHRGSCDQLRAWREGEMAVLVGLSVGLLYPPEPRQAEGHDDSDPD